MVLNSRVPALGAAAVASAVRGKTSPGHLSSTDSDRMPKKQKRTEREIRALIISDARIRIGCSDFAPAFTLHRTEIDPSKYPSANWDVESTEGVELWPPDCTQAFREAVARARRKFDMAWP